MGWGRAWGRRRPGPALGLIRRGAAWRTTREDPVTPVRCRAVAWKLNVRGLNAASTTRRARAIARDKRSTSHSRPLCTTIWTAGPCSARSSAACGCDGGSGSPVPTCTTRRLSARASPGKTMTDRTPAPTSAAAFSGQHVAGAETDLAQRDEQRQRGRRQTGHLQPLHERKVVAVENEGGQPSDDEQQQRRRPAAVRRLGDGVQVEGHARADEEHRDEEAVADGVELLLEGVHVAVAPTCGARRRPGRRPSTTSSPKSSATTSRAKSRTPSTAASSGRSRARPRARILPSRSWSRPAGAAIVSSPPAPPIASSDSSPTNEPLAPRKIAIATIGRNSPTAPAARMKGPNAPTQHVVVAQDRQQGAEGGRREPDRDGHERLHEADRLEHPVTASATATVTSQAMMASRARPLAEQAPARARSRRAGTGSPARRSRSARCCPGRPIRAIGPDQDAAEDQQDDLGHPQALQQPGDERREGRDEADHQEGVEPFWRLMPSSADDRERRWPGPTGH